MKFKKILNCFATYLLALDIKFEKIVIKISKAPLTNKTNMIMGIKKLCNLIEVDLG
jgi:hypothetical protein